MTGISIFSNWLNRNQKRSKSIWNGGLRCACLATAIWQMAANPTNAFDAGVGWGTTGSSAGNDPFTSSAATHANNGMAAVYAEQGRDAQLPGATITTIGVFNQLSVVGDENTLTTSQTGENSGDVTSDTDLAYENIFVEPESE